LWQVDKIASAGVVFIDIGVLEMSCCEYQAGGIGVQGSGFRKTTRRAGIPVISDCVTTNQQILNVVGVQQPQEIFEVGM
jgi:hypothetical protein